MSSSAKADDLVNSGARDLAIEIIPVGICRFDKSDLPGSIPTLETLLSPNCGFDVSMRFKIDEPLDSILFGEARHRTCPMLIHSAHQIIRYSNVKRSAEPARDNIDPIITVAAHARRSVGSVDTGSSAFADDDKVVQ